MARKVTLEYVEKAITDTENKITEDKLEEVAKENIIKDKDIILIDAKEEIKFENDITVFGEFIINGKEIKVSEVIDFSNNNKIENLIVNFDDKTIYKLVSILKGLFISKLEKEFEYFDKEIIEKLTYAEALCECKIQKISEEK